MQHTCYRLVSDHNNQTLNSLTEVKSTVDNWEKEGDSNIKIFRIITHELGSDAIDLEEEQINLTDISLK